MSFDINEESTKLIEVINDDKFNWPKFANKNNVHDDVRKNFLWRVLKLTAKYPQVELYLKNILSYFTINELETMFDGWTILHSMCAYLSGISLNTFEIVINYGVNVNIERRYNVAIHFLFDYPCSEHVNNILDLLIKNNVNLNIVNPDGLCVLDILARNCHDKLNEVTKNCIMTIIDFGGISNNPMKNNVIYDFIECYKCSSIKPAIKK